MAAPEILIYDMVQPHEIEVEVATSGFIYSPLYDHDYISSPLHKPIRSPKKQGSRKSPKITKLTAIYKCNICGYSTMKRAVMDKHKDIHKLIKPGTKYIPCKSCSVQTIPDDYEKCTKCSYYAKNKKCLKLHMKIHTNGRPYKCTVCEFYGVDLKDLINHYRTCKDFTHSC